MNASKQIDSQIAGLKGWCGDLMKELRKLIHEADPEIIEEWKWGTGVWSHNGMVCAIGAFKDHMKVNFFKGAQLTDKHKLFNSGLEAKTSRSININPGEKIDKNKFKDLIKEAVAFNTKGK